MLRLYMCSQRRHWQRLAVAFKTKPAYGISLWFSSDVATLAGVAVHHKRLIIWFVLFIPGIHELPAFV